MKKPTQVFKIENLIKWINDDPFREAILISEVPVKATTLARIKSGSYKPSALMQNQFVTVMERNK